MFFLFRNCQRAYLRVVASRLMKKAMLEYASPYFLVDKNLHVGQAILITIRKTNRQGLKMMIVIDII